MPGLSFGKCSSKRFLSFMYTLYYIRSRRIGTNRKRVRKESRKRVERKVGGGKGDFLVFSFVFNLSKQAVPALFFNHTP